MRTAPRFLSCLPLGALVVLGLIGTAAGGAGLGPRAHAGPARTPAANPPPGLWIAESLAPDGGVRGATRICADLALRVGFVRPVPLIDGQRCEAVGPAVTRTGLYAVRCEAAGRSYRLRVVTRGDLDRDIAVVVALRPLGSGGPGVREVTRYRFAGACPAGWRVGDTTNLGVTKIATRTYRASARVPLEGAP